jgi:hypothetical protein
MYELWDAESGNLLKTYPSEAAALTTVRAFRDAHGDSAAEGLGLIRVDQRGRGALVAEGAALLDMALRGQQPSSAARAS